MKRGGHFIRKTSRSDLHWSHFFLSSKGSVAVCVAARGEKQKRLIPEVSFLPNFQRSMWLDFLINGCSWNCSGEISTTMVKRKNWRTFSFSPSFLSLSVSLSPLSKFQFTFNFCRKWWRLQPVEIGTVLRWIIFEPLKWCKFNSQEWKYFWHETLKERRLEKCAGYIWYIFIFGKVNDAMQAPSHLHWF